MGVVTIVTIDYGRIYGPLPKSSIVADPVSHIGSLTNQNACQKITLQVNPDEAKDLNQPMEWLCYIHPAKTEDEQNMEAYIKEGQIYYRALRMIKAHEELFIWYSKDFALLIGIPEIQRPMNGERQSYICPYCGELYDYPFPLRAHVRFKCPKRRVWSSSEKLVTISLDNKDTGPRSPTKEKRGAQDNYVYKTYHSTTKRGSGEIKIPEYSPAKRHSTELTDSKEISFDCNQNVKSNGFMSEDGHSAFRKVDKTNSMCYERPHNLEQAMPTSSRELSYGMSVITPSSMSNTMSHLRPQRGVPSNMLIEPRLSMFPMMPPIHPAMVQLPRPALFGAMQLNSVMDNGGSLKFKPKHGTDLLKNIENSNPSLLNSSKSPLTFDKPRTPYSVVRTMNPIMEKMMHSIPASMHSPLSSVNVLQNCCAQCSASFRMTSDLVYHMRSHHKREFDPMKRKREEKLRCNICSESFRERHHLTRHMTSHL